MQLRSKVELGHLIPLVLLLAFAADIASRFISYDTVSFRAWEALGRYARSGIGGPFEPNRRYVSDRSYGDLAAMGNLPEYRQYRRQVFTTDAFGFRNQPAAREVIPAAILFGSSFSIGASLTDDETLSAQLGAIMGRGVYNAAGGNLEDEDQFVALLKRLRMTSGVVICEYVDTAPIPVSTGLPPPKYADRREALLHRYAPRLIRFYPKLRGWLAPSPLELMLFTRLKLLKNDSLLPNPYASTVKRDVLANGDGILFYPDSSAHSSGEAAQAAKYWKGLQQRLRAHGLSLLVVLVPGKAQVYAPLTRSPPPVQTPTFLESLDQDLRAANVPVVDLSEPFRTAAREGLESRHYIYWRDDTHWNADGVALAAQQIASRLKVMDSQ
jgi:hypothetical protein